MSESDAEQPNDDPRDRIAHRLAWARHELTLYQDIVNNQHATIAELEYQLGFEDGRRQG